MRLFVALFTAIPMVFIALGSMNVLRQHEAVAGYLPAAATVLSSTYDISSRMDAKGNRTTWYAVKVEYQYAAGGVTFGGRAVFPRYEPAKLSDAATDRPAASPAAVPDPGSLPDSTRDKADADRIVARFAPGKPATAWYDPANPTRAYLVRRIDFTPYLFVLGPMLHLSVGIGLALAGVGRRGAGRALPLPVKGGWFELSVRQPLARRKRPWGVLSVLWYVVGAAAGAHYFSLGPAPVDVMALWALPIYAVLGLVPVIGWVYYRRLTKHVGEARVWVDASPLASGRSFRARGEQPFRARLPVTAYKIGLVCEATTRTESVTSSGSSTTRTVEIRSHVAYEQWADPLAIAETSPAQPVSVKATLKARGDVPPTSPPGFGDYPRYAWSIRVVADIPNHPDYKAQFPVVVVAE